MIILKEGVRIHGIRPEMLLGLIIVAQVYEYYGYDCVITSVTDGTHSRGSLHYQGSAIDTRVNGIPTGKVNLITKKCKVIMGDDFDIVLEKDHIHFEYQPKNPY